MTTVNRIRRFCMQGNILVHLSFQKPLWLAFMVAASVAFSLGFACATPLAAFGAISALTLDRRNAVLFTGAVWAANQAVGYSILDYPVTANSLAWGAVIGLAAILAALAARWCATRFAERSQVAAIIAGFVAGFVVYELALFAAAFMVLGGTEAFAVAIVARILEINAIAMTGLALINHIGALIARPEGMDRPLTAG
jgi:hypothetical protein